MAAAKAFGVAGLRLWICSGDHEPPHFHARKPGDWCIRVYFLEDRSRMIEIVGPPDARMSRSDRRALVEGAETHRLALLVEWESCQAE